MSVSKETISRITDKVVEEMQSWQARPLDGVYAAVFIDAIMVKVGDEQVASRPVYAAIGVSLPGEKDILREQWPLLKPYPDMPEQRQAPDRLCVPRCQVQRAE